MKSEIKKIPPFTKPMLKIVKRLLTLNSRKIKSLARLQNEDENVDEKNNDVVVKRR
jgi:hypothetical protein